ncbi:MAG: CRISPR-associated endonuclease Cas2 [Cyanobacteria bacterium J06592_8]
MLIFSQITFSSHPNAVKLYIITYDITSDRRRRQVSHLLEGYGRRVQYSVFECVLTVAKYNELRRRMKPRINFNEDSIRFYPLSGHTLSQVEAWGVGQPIADSPCSVIV